MAHVAGIAGCMGAIQLLRAVTRQTRSEVPCVHSAAMSRKLSIAVVRVLSEHDLPSSLGGPRWGMPPYDEPTDAMLEVPRCVKPPPIGARGLPDLSICGHGSSDSSGHTRLHGYSLAPSLLRQSGRRPRTGSSVRRPSTVECKVMDRRFRSRVASTGCSRADAETGS